MVYHFFNALLKYICGVMNVSESGGIGSSKVMILHGQLNSQAVTLIINFRNLENSQKLIATKRMLIRKW